MLKLSYKNIDKQLYKDYLKYLIVKYFNINLNDNIINNNSFLHFSCFYPLPNSLEISFYDENDRIIKENNTYTFTGKPSTRRILFANRLLPNPNTDPIPFTLLVKTNINTIELINTNCFYYEVTMDEKIRDSWNNEIISIGYGSITTPLRCNPGGIFDTIGYNFIDGSVLYNKNIINNFGPICNIGDTVGTILIYISPNNYKVFFTFNGSLILNNINIYIKSQIIPIIGYDHSCKIKVNFGNEIFKFNIKKFSNANFIISQNNKFINNHNFINKINSINLIKNKNTLFSDVNQNTLFQGTELNENNQTIVFSPVFSFVNNAINSNTFDQIILNIIT